MDLFPFEKLLVRKFIFQPIFAIRVRGAQVKPKEKVQTLAGLRGPELGPRKIGMSRGQYGNQILGVGGMLGRREEALPGSFWPLPAGNRNLFSVRVSSFAAAALSLERPARLSSGRF